MYMMQMHFLLTHVNQLKTTLKTLKKKDVSNKACYIMGHSKPYTHKVNLQPSGIVNLQHFSTIYRYCLFIILVFKTFKELFNVNVEHLEILI